MHSKEIKNNAKVHKHKIYGIRRKRTKVPVYIHERTITILYICFQPFPH